MSGLSLQLERLVEIIFRPAVILGAIVSGFCLAAVFLAGLWLTRQPDLNPAPATAVLQIIALPTATDTPLPTPTVEGGEAVPTPPPGEIAIGAFVQVVGTQGTGLRLRTEPGLNGEVRLLASEAEVFRVEQGPVQADGYTWWYLVGPFDQTRFGWAVANYLQAIQNP